MIKANELRIGNIVSIYKPEYQEAKSRFSDVYHKVLSINGEIYVCRNALFESYKPEDLYGVPLTEELLLKCGFLNPSIYFTHKAFGEDVLFLAMQQYHGGIAGLYIICKGKCLCHISYLHQLQNLFFVLTGQELTVNI